MKLGQLSNPSDSSDMVLKFTVILRAKVPTGVFWPTSYNKLLGRAAGEIVRGS